MTVVTQDITDAARESRVRAKARRMGYCIKKSRQLESIDNLGAFQLLDGHGYVVDGHRYELSLVDVEDWLGAIEAGTPVEVVQKAHSTVREAVTQFGFIEDGSTPTADEAQFIGEDEQNDPGAVEREARRNAN